jgi:hypothetical protein
MWILKETETKLCYDPLIAHSVAFLLIFFSEYEVYHIVKLNIANSI